MDGIFDFLQLALQNFWTYGVTFLVVLSVLVFVHEWGHYIVARLCGVRVEVFSIGFGKELFGFHDKHGTRWKFSLIPLGGYVKMFGDVDPASAGHTEQVQDETGSVRSMTSSEREEAFFNKSVGKRSLIVAAGPAINFLFAILVLAGVYIYAGKPIVPPYAMGVEIGSAAEKAGFLPHDKILSVNGQQIQSFDQIRRSVMLALDTPMQFTIDRAGQVLDLTATPQKLEAEDRFGFKHERGYLGLIGPANGLDVSAIEKVNGVSTNGNLERTRELLRANMDRQMTLEMKPKTDAAPQHGGLVVKPPSDMNPHLMDVDHPESKALILGIRPGDETISYGPFEAVWEATIETGRITIDSLQALGQMVTGVRSPTELGGIIRIGAIAGDMAERGVIALLIFTALLSINLGLINLFPIPMLDGGHLTFYAIEAIKGQPLSERTQEYAFRFGLVVLVTLMVYANLNDIIQLIL